MHCDARRRVKMWQVLGHESAFLLVSGEFVIEQEAGQVP
jgi:hypothetical protein